jgi:hypothetical protein
MPTYVDPINLLLQAKLMFPPEVGAHLKVGDFEDHCPVCRNRLFERGTLGDRGLFECMHCKLPFIRCNPIMRLVEDPPSGDAAAEAARVGGPAEPPAGAPPMSGQPGRAAVDEMERQREELGTAIDKIQEGMRLGKIDMKEGNEVLVGLRSQLDGLPRPRPTGPSSGGPSTSLGPVPADTPPGGFDDAEPPADEAGENNDPDGPNYGGMPPSTPRRPPGAVARREKQLARREAKKAGRKKATKKSGRKKKVKRK